MRRGIAGRLRRLFTFRERVATEGSTTRTCGCRDGPTGVCSETADCWADDGLHSASSATLDGCEGASQGRSSTVGDFDGFDAGCCAGRGHPARPGQRLPARARRAVVRGRLATAVCDAVRVAGTMAACTWPPRSSRWLPSSPWSPRSLGATMRRPRSSSPSSGWSASFVPGVPEVELEPRDRADRIPAAAALCSGAQHVADRLPAQCSADRAAVRGARHRQHRRRRPRRVVDAAGAARGRLRARRRRRAARRRGRDRDRASGSACRAGW